MRVLTLGLHLHRFVQCATVHVVANGHRKIEFPENDENSCDDDDEDEYLEKSDEFWEPSFDDMNEEGRTRRIAIIRTARENL